MPLFKVNTKKITNYVNVFEIIETKIKKNQKKNNKMHENDTATTTTTTNIDNLIDNFNYDDFLIDIAPLQQNIEVIRHNSIDTNDTPSSSCAENSKEDDEICIKMLNDEVISSSSSSNDVDLNLLYNLKLENSAAICSGETTMQISYNELFNQQQINGMSKIFTF